MKTKKLLISSLGYVLEWYDFGLFIFMAPFIGATFFSKVGDNNSSLEAFFVFALGFLCRPLGGLFFGYFGDTRGRATTLRFSVLIITLSTLLIGLIPSYETIGMAAPILFIILRLLQGFSIGGEYSGIAFTYNLGNALFGGTMPVIAGMLINQLGPLAPAYYLIVMALIRAC